MNVDVVIKKKFVLTIRFDMKEDKKEETMNPKFHWGGLDLQNRRNFSAFFGQTRQVRSDREVRVTLESRNEKKFKKKHMKKHPLPLCTSR